VARAREKSLRMSIAGGVCRCGRGQQPPVNLSPLIQIVEVFPLHRRRRWITKGETVDTNSKIRSGERRRSKHPMMMPMIMDAQYGS